MTLIKMSNYKRDKARRELLKNSGLCPRCGRIIYDKNYITCEICRAKATKREIPEDKQAKYKQNKQAKYEQIKQNGICVTCKKRPAANGLVRCDICNAKNKQKANKYFSENAKKGFKELGLCIICGEPTVDGKSYCSEHLKEKQLIAAENRKKINRKNHIWKKLNDKTFNNGDVANEL